MNLRYRAWFRLVSRTMCFAALLWLATACGGWLRPFHPTPLDALTEFAGYLTDADGYVETSVEVPQQRQVANGQILLYRWQAPLSKETDTCCAAVTFVAPIHTLRGKGWGAQSSILLGGRRTGNTVECNLPANAFVAGRMVVDNRPNVTVACGFASGDRVRIDWSDGQSDTVSIDSDSFLLARSGRVQVRRFELLNSVGDVLEVIEGGL